MGSETLFAQSANNQTSITSTPRRLCRDPKIWRRPIGRCLEASCPSFALAVQYGLARQGRRRSGEYSAVRHSRAWWNDRKNDRGIPDPPAAPTWRGLAARYGDVPRPRPSHYESVRSFHLGPPRIIVTVYGGDAFQLVLSRAARVPARSRPLWVAGSVWRRLESLHHPTAIGRWQLAENCNRQTTADRGPICPGEVVAARLGSNCGGRGWVEMSYMGCSDGRAGGGSSCSRPPERSSSACWRACRLV